MRSPTQHAVCAATPLHAGRLLVIHCAAGMAKQTSAGGPGIQPCQEWLLQTLMLLPRMVPSGQNLPEPRPYTPSNSWP